MCLNSYYIFFNEFNRLAYFYIYIYIYIVNIGYCVLRIRLYTSDFLNIELTLLLYSRKCYIMKLVQRSPYLATLNQLSWIFLRKSVIYCYMIFLVQHHFHCLNVNYMSILNLCNSSIFYKKMYLF